MLKERERILMYICTSMYPLLCLRKSPLPDLSEPSELNQFKFSLLNRPLHLIKGPSPNDKCYIVTHATEYIKFAKIRLLQSVRQIYEGAYPHVFYQFLALYMRKPGVNMYFYFSSADTSKLKMAVTSLFFIGF